MKIEIGSAYLRAMVLERTTAIRKVALTLIAALTVLPFASTTATAGPNSSHLVSAMSTYTKLKVDLKGTRIPVLVPGLLREEDAGHVVPFFNFATKDAYQFDLVMQKGCNAGACHFGTISGKLAPRTRPIGKPVRLRLGVTGYVVPSRLYAYLSDEIVTFDWHGYRYQFAERGGALQEICAKIVRLR